ncbi:hypothetical protein [Alistipes putredinis]|uniref:hypothetical protein n=1 Tax=Alistipes putredinis TaxID=28117 RepID=UPI00242FE37F|nr:hypothetical protein [Alistipes putredinis]MBS6650646.1 hypothetical protein [Alistipes putredinis]
MELKIYSKEGNLKLTASPDSNSAATCGIQEESVLSLSFTAFECVTLEVYDYADFLGRRYWILERYQPKMNCDSEWSYSVQLSGVEGLTTQVLMVNPDDDDNPILTLTAPAREHAALIIANMNRKMGTTEWKVGEVVVSEYIDIEYTGKYTSDALSELSSAVGTEWWFDGMTLNISRCEFGEPVPLSYGNGLIGGIERSMADGVKFFTRLFPVGSSRNIDPDRYGHTRLQLPDGAKYVEQDTHLGIIEYFEQEAFDAIYPRRIGTVGSVRSEERTSDDGSPFTVWYFTDPDIPFDPNQYEIGGLVKRVTFQTGELRGREFEVNYDSEKKEFEIITQWPYDNDMQLPSEPLVPAPGNEYVLWNISMPDSYYPAAEQEFKTAVDTFMADSRKDISVFQASTDFTVVDKKNLDLKPGQRIRLGSDKFFPDGGYRDIRIVAISRSVVQPGSMTLKMSDVLSTGRISRIENQISEVTQITRQVSSEFPDIIKSWEETPASDTTLYSSRKSEREFLNKRRGGTVEGITRFLKRQQLDEGFLTSDFASGITGFGAQIDGRGAGELESLFIRRFLEVPELRYNRVGISVGDDWSAPGAGVIESVDKEQKLVTLKLEEGEIGAVAVEDICMGIFHDFDPSNNATADSDDGRGNRTFAGFATVYFRITEVLGDRNERFRYELRLLSATFTKQIDPMESMTFVAYGSFTNPARRSSRYSTRTYQRYLRNVSDWEFTAENIAAQFGDLTNLSVFGIQMSGYSAYLDNIYLQGMISSLDKKALLDTRSKLFRLVGDNGVGVAFTPEAGWKQGKLYDPATGQFQKEFDIEQIDQTATEAQDTANSADRKAQQAKDYIDNTLPGELSEINKRLDGVVENWFYPYTPSLYNEPAQTWIADGEQENHIGDTFTNTLPANFDPTDAGCWEQGSIGASYIDGIKTWDQIKIADSTRIRLKTPVGGIPKGAVLSVGEGYTMGYNPIASSGAVIASYVWSQSYTVGSDNPYIAFVIRKTDNAKITPAEYPQIHFTISSDKTTNPDAGKSWRWVKEEDGTYKWTLIADSDAVKALQEAARAQDTADAKRRVFVVTPTTPYDVGDIWTQGEGGDIMRCIESRATGNFESSDWDKASKYTDDTAANEAKERLAAMSSDGTLSKEEKPAVRQQWSQIQKEYAKYQTDATSFGVSITALKGAYDALAAYLSSIGLTSDTDTTIVPDTFNQKFADYYAEVSRFSNLVAQKQADEAVDNLQVGARNYIAKQFLYAWNSAKEGVSDVVTTGTDTDGAYMRIDANKASNAGVATPLADGITSFEDCFGGKIAYKSGMSYVFKARIKQPNSKRGVMFCAVYDDNTFQFMATPPSSTASELYEAVYTTQAGKSLQKIVLYVVTWNPIYLYDVQLTEGNKAPAGYLVAEEDIKFGARNYIAKQFIREWNSVKEGVTDVVTSGADADGTYLYVNWSKLLQAGLAATNASQVSTVPDCFGGQIKYKPNTPYVFKARIKQGAEITFRIAYEDGTKEVLSAPPAGTEGVYEVVHTIDASRVVQKIYMNIRDGVSMYLYDIQLTEGNKAPTGYITAEEDVQAQIEQVKLNVDYIASDSSLTPSDKQQVANEWARIQGEYWSIMARADQYNVPTEAFTFYFQRLEDYLTPLLADMSTTSEITGTEFRDVFSDYYRLSCNTSDLIDEAADEAIKSTEYLKQAMEDGSTEVKGGLVMTNVMLMKNMQGEVTAGVSGLQEDDVPFWSGADYTNRKKAVFRVHADGEVHATKGTVGILQVKNDSVEVSDATASGDKIILTPYRITSVSQVLGASSVPGVVETKEVSALATGQSNPFVRNVYESSPPFTCGQGVQMSARITGRITGNAEGGGGGVKIEVVNALTGKADPLYRNSTAEAQNTNLNIDATISHLFTGAAQKYYIRITVEASAAGKLTASATVNAAQFNFVKDIRKNLIAPNGVAVVKGSSNYAVFTGDIFEVLIGKAGLRIQNGYVYKRDTDHTTWTKI